MKCAAWIFAWLALAAGVRAAIIDTSMVIDAEHSFPGEAIEVVDGANPPTVVDLLEGGVVGGPGISPGIYVRGRSRMNVVGGSIAGTYPKLESYDDSEVLVDGEYIFFAINSYGFSKARLAKDSEMLGIDLYDHSHFRSDGAAPGVVSTHGFATARIFDSQEGTLGALSVNSFDSSEMRIRDSWLEGLDAYDNSTILMSGNGYLATITDNAELHLVGRTRFIDPIVVEENASLHVYGYNLRLTLGDDEFDTLVQGLDRQHRPFSTTYRLFDNGRIVLHELPEPSTIALGGVALVALVCARRFSANQ